MIRKASIIRNTETETAFKSVELSKVRCRQTLQTWGPWKTSTRHDAKKKDSSTLISNSPDLNLIKNGRKKMFEQLCMYFVGCEMFYQVKKKGVGSDNQLFSV
jgi:hypothetical protein